jgi:drug/metabolite transporter (DMT)-like permease
VGTVVKLAIPNMVIWHLFAICAVKMLSSGRAAILGYTMPIWAVVWGLVIFRDRIALSAWIGIGCALTGTVLLLSGEIAALTGSPAGTLLMLVAAAGWGFGTQLMKRTHTDVPIGALTFWMLAITLPFLGAGTLLFDRLAHADRDRMGRHRLQRGGGLRVLPSGLVRAGAQPAAGGVEPVDHVHSRGRRVLGHVVLGETPHWQDYVAIVLMFAALSSVMLAPLLRRRL